MHARLLLFLTMVMFQSAQAAETNRVQGRSMVISPYGIVASEQPLASQAAATILAQGGSAADAAVAANAAMGVVSPMMCGIGGDLFAIYYEAKSGRVYGLNASGWAPAKLTPEFLTEHGITNKMPQSGIHCVTVPGAVNGWDLLLKRFGRKSFAEVLAPAIALAERGFPVTELDHEYWIACEKLLRRDEHATKVFLPENRVPGVGERFRNPEIGWSYRQIADHGRDGYYKGELAQRLITRSHELGGALERADLEESTAEWVETLSTTYHDWTVFEIPPNGQGIAALSMLNIMERFPLSQFGAGSVDALHYMIEAKKLAYADMIEHVADPRFNKIPVAEMLAKPYAARRAKGIQKGMAAATAAPGNLFEAGPETTYLCVVDRDGNMVSYIQSNYNAFGSGIVPPGLGFALQNRGGLFSLNPQHPNYLAGRKRPVHTIIPAFMSKGNLRVAFGIMGGWNQSQAHAQFVANVVDFGMNIQQAMEAPRFTKMTFAGNDVEMENRIPENIRAELTARGHEIRLLPPFSGSVGGGQAVMRNVETGINYGASDSRKDGAAIPEPYPAKE
ncbi:MAG: gamma-glutamyltransferase [Verrucomicrobiales bacterium]|nr:gamma-glutamyltransferase [Verrucomicrobiales bacterium]